MLVISLMAYAEYNTNIQSETRINFDTYSYNELVDDEFLFQLISEDEDESMDFDTKDYLPPDFNANSKLYLLKYELEMEEQDDAFEFDTKDYLPLGFNPLSKTDMLVYEELNEEIDDIFEFDTKKFLPTNFNPYGQPTVNETVAQL